MNFLKITLTVIGVVGIFGFLTRSFISDKQPVAASIYDFKMLSLEGDTIDFNQFRGRNLLIVNTASKCGYTYQYAGLQKLHEQYGDKVTVLGFPANNFLWQEPGSNGEIASFCKHNYGVTFTMFEKISVKGRDKHPLYKWLEVQSGKSPSWNFCKYLVNGDGKVIGFFSPKVDPLDPQIVDKLK
jgi:glutathione peroxidase